MVALFHTVSGHGTEGFKAWTKRQKQHGLCAALILPSSELLTTTTGVIGNSRPRSVRFILSFFAKNDSLKRYDSIGSDWMQQEHMFFSVNTTYILVWASHNKAIIWFWGPEIYCTSHMDHFYGIYGAFLSSMKPGNFIVIR